MKRKRRDGAIGAVDVDVVRSGRMWSERLELGCDWSHGKLRPPLPPGAHLKKIDTNDGRHVGVVDVVDIVDAF